METAKRELTSVLAAPERKLLRWTATKLPRPIRPNHLTGLGVLASIGVAYGYYMSARDPLWLWFASGMVALNWFGDSLDGTLARVRQIERPKYGYYLDHMVDAFNTAVVGAGIGLSPYVSLDLALIIVVIYLSLSINLYLESSVFGVFEMGYGIFGPTEVRILLVLVNAAFFAGTTWAALSPNTVARLANLVVGVVCVAMFAALAIRFAINLTRLARLEPQREDGRGR